MRHMILSCIAVLGPLAAQQPPRDLLTADLYVPIHSKANPAYGIWAAGSDFKVAFHRGFELVPYLGADYPENLPWRWHTESVSIGDREYVDHDAVGRRAREDRYEYDLGSVVEAYDVTSSDVEQSFTVRDAPGEIGDLIVTGVVDTPLEAAIRGMAHEPLRFAGPAGETIVEYGTATAIDARGELFPMASSWDGRRICLRLDAARVREAAFPLVVDPALLSASTVRAIGMTAIAVPDVSTKRTVCYTRVASAGDHDVYALQYDDGWTNRRVVLSDTTSAYSTNRVACAGWAFWPVYGVFIAYEQRYSDRTEIQVVTPDTNGVSVTLRAAPGVHLRSPAMSAGTERNHMLCLVYDERTATSSNIRAMVVYQAHLLTSPVPFVLKETIASPGQEVGPRVERLSAGCRIYWVDDGGTDCRLMSRDVKRDPNGFSLEPTTQTLLRSTRYSFHEPRLAGDSRFLTYVQKPRGIGTQAVVAARFENGSFGSSRIIHGGKTYTNCALGFDDETYSHVMATFVVHDGLSREIRFARLGSDARVTSTMYSTAAGRPFTPDVAFTNNDPNALQHGQFVGIWATEESNNPVYGQDMPYPLEPFQPLIVLGTPDCGGTDELSGFRQPSLAGHEFFNIRLEETAQLAVLLIGVNATAIPLGPIGMTGCYLNVDAFASIPAVYNAGWQAPLPLSSSPAAVGANLLVQWVWDDPAANPAGFVSSSAVRVRIR